MNTPKLLSLLALLQLLQTDHLEGAQKTWRWEWNPNKPKKNTQTTQERRPVTDADTRVKLPPPEPIPQRYLPPVPFTVDPRWKDWNENPAPLVEASVAAGERKDFIEKERNDTKLAYARSLAKYLKDTPVSPGDERNLEAWKRSKANLIKEREVQEKFGNKDDVSRIDSQLNKADEQIALLAPKAVSEDYQKLPLLIQSDLANQNLYTPQTIFFIAFRDDWEPLLTGDSSIRDLNSCRSQLAKQSVDAPEAVQKKALALNEKIKAIQQDLQADRVREGRTKAVALWKEILQ